MKFTKTKLVVATTLALAVSGANAATISGSTVLVNILKDGQTGPSMLIDTLVPTTDFRDNSLTSWESNADLTAAIDAFIGASTDVEFYVAGYEDAGLNKYALANKTQLDKPAIDLMQGNFQSFVNNANSGQFATAEEGISENWKVGIPDGDLSHYGENLLFGNGFVAGFDMNSPAPFFYSQWSLLSPTSTDVALLDWNLSDTGLLTYGVSAVPVPAAVWLFGSGLLGLVGVARRRTA
jgi:hypothetical protein